MLSQYPGMLSDAELWAVDGAMKALVAMNARIGRFNTVLMVDYKLPVRPLSAALADIGRLHHELDDLLFAHELAMDKLRAAACAHPERMAA